MVTVTMRWLIRDRDRHGNVRYYVRRPGRKKVRIRETPGTEAFLAAYQRALGHTVSLASPNSGTFRWLCDRYYRSAEFKQLSPRTQYVRRRILDQICARHGEALFAELEPRHVRAQRDESTERPEAASGRIKALRQLYAWAMEADLAARNPAREVPYLRGNPEGFHTWTVEEVERYRTRHPVGSRARLALELLLFTGARRSDVVTFGRQMIRDGWLCWTEAKGRARRLKERAVPVLQPLQTVLDSTPSEHLNFLVTQFGKPFTPAGFGNWFRRRCNEAGLFHCSAHGLRKAGATIAAENGATEHELMAIYGWESPKQAALYTKKANRRALAGRAMYRLVPPDAQEVPPVAQVIERRR